MTQASNRKNTKIETVRTVFYKHLPKIGKVNRREFRREVLEEIIKETGSSKNSASVMYDSVKKQAESEGEIPRGIIGHRPNTLAKLNPDFAWTIVRKKDNVPQAQAISRRKAEAFVKDSEKIVKTEDLLKGDGQEDTSKDDGTQDGNGNNQPSTSATKNEESETSKETADA